MLSVLLCLCFMHAGTAQWIQPSHADLTQQASAVCYRRNGSYVMKFELMKNADTISNVYLVDPADRTQNTVGQLDSLGSEISGDGSVGAPYVLEVVVNGPLNALSIETPNALAAISPYGAVEINVMAKEKADIPEYWNLHFGNDVLWRAECNFSVEIIVDTFGLILGDIVELADIISDGAQLQVFNNAFNTSAVVATTNDKIYLGLTLSPSATARGIYAYNCSVCDNQYCNGSTAFLFIDGHGCALFPGLSAFALYGDSVRTLAFNAFTFTGEESSTIYFRCSVGFCYDDGASECQNFCDSHTGRRKRDTESSPDAPQDPPQDLRTSITVGVSYTKTSIGDTGIQQNEEIPDDTVKPYENVLIITVITLACILTIVLFVAVALFIHIRFSQKPKTKQNKS